MKDSTNYLIPSTVPTSRRSKSYDALSLPTSTGDSAEDIVFAHTNTPNGETRTSQPSATFQIVLYRDRHMVVFNPETRLICARELSTADEAAIGTRCPVRCPMCRHLVDPNTFSFEAQSYFYLLQDFLRGTTTSNRPNNGTSDIPVDTNTTSTSPNPFCALRIPMHVPPQFTTASTPTTATPHRNHVCLASAPTAITPQPTAKPSVQFQDFSHSTISVHTDSTRGLCSSPSPVLNSHHSHTQSGEVHMQMDAAISPLATQASVEDVMQFKVIQSSCSQFEGADLEDIEGEFPSTKNIPRSILLTGYYKRFFREIHKLGSGSFGQVYLCHHILDDLMLGEYAVKKVPVGDDRVWLQNMIREVKIRERLHNPYVVDYKHSWLEMHRSSEVCPYVPWLFVLMEYCNGGDLEALCTPHLADVDSKLFLTESIIWKIFVDVVHGLQHLHHNGILHRDLKLSNILLQSGYDEVLATFTSQALLADFGTAQLISDQKNCLEFNRRGFTGTVEFTAPELLKTDAQGSFTEVYDIKSDMWGLGVVLFALAYNMLPYSADEPQTCRINILKDQRNVKPSCGHPRSRDLELLIEALLSRDPSDRPSTDDLISNAKLRCYLADTNKLTASASELATLLLSIKSTNQSSEGARLSSKEIHYRRKLSNSNHRIAIMPSTQIQPLSVTSSTSSALDQNRGHTAQGIPVCKGRLMLPWSVWHDPRLNFK